MTAIHLEPRTGRPRPIPRHAATDRLGKAVRRIRFTLLLWNERMRARHDLARLNERMLADIGLTPFDRDFLVNKPFWRE